MDSISKELASAVLKSLIPVTAPRVRGAHDSQMVIVNGKAYVVYEANDVCPGENGWWPYVYCAMSIVDVCSQKVIDVLTIAEPSQRFNNTCLKSGATFVPRILVKDECTLRVYFVSMSPTERETESWYRDFNTTTNTFSENIYPIMMVTESGPVMLTPTVFYAGAQKVGFNKPLTQDGPYLFDVDKVIGGKRYVMINIFCNKLNALAEWNDTLDTVRILSYIFEPQTEDFSESAIEKTRDGRWVAILRNDAGDQNYRFVESLDAIKWSDTHSCPAIHNSSNSKPLLYCFNGIYLCGWQEKPARSRFNIDVSIDFSKWIRLLSFDDMNFSLQYPSLYVWEDDIYICATHCFPGDSGDRRDSIYFGKLMSLQAIRNIISESIPLVD